MLSHKALNNYITVFNAVEAKLASDPEIKELEKKAFLGRIGRWLSNRALNKRIVEEFAANVARGSFKGITNIYDRQIAEQGIRMLRKQLESPNISPTYARMLQQRIARAEKMFGLAPLQATTTVGETASAVRTTKSTKPTKAIKPTKTTVPTKTTEVAKTTEVKSGTPTTQPPVEQGGWRPDWRSIALGGAAVGLPLAVGTGMYVANRAEDEARRAALMAGGAGLATGLVAPRVLGWAKTSSDKVAAELPPLPITEAAHSIAPYLVGAGLALAPAGLIGYWLANKKSKEEQLKKSLMAAGAGLATGYLARDIIPALGEKLQLLGAKMQQPPARRRSQYEIY